MVYPIIYPNNYFIDNNRVIYAGKFGANDAVPKKKKNGHLIYLAQIGNYPLSYYKGDNH